MGQGRGHRVYGGAGFSRAGFFAGAGRKAERGLVVRGETVFYGAFRGAGHDL